MAWQTAPAVWAAALRRNCTRGRARRRSKRFGRADFGSGCGVVQAVLELGEELLDRVQVGRVFGRKNSLAPTARTARRTALPRCEPRLSRITTSPGASVGTSTFSI